MAVETLKKRTAQIALDNGVDAQGNEKTVNISLARISASGWDADKFIAIVSALEPCLDKSTNAAYATATYAVTAS